MHARKRAQHLQAHVQEAGLKVLTCNCQGLSYFKALMLLELSDADVLCLKETWLSKGGCAPDVPGYVVHDQRRSKGKRGGFAMLVRKGLHCKRTMCNEYAQLVDIQLEAGR